MTKDSTTTENNNYRVGSCLCGAVEIRVQKKSCDLGACHCPSCLAWSGGPFLELECGSNVEIRGEQHVKRFESSSWAIRGFCQHCGSHLFMQDTASQHYGVPVGLFDDTNGIRFNRQVFYDKKPHYYDFSNSTQNIDSDFIYKHYPHTQCPLVEDREK